MIPVLLLTVWMLNPAAAQSDRQCVCHVENEDTGKGHVIEVDKNSLEGHLRHGDVQCTADCDKVIGERCHLSTAGACAPEKEP